MLKGKWGAKSARGVAIGWRENALEGVRKERAGNIATDKSVVPVNKK